MASRALLRQLGVAVVALMALVVGMWMAGFIPTEVQSCVYDDQAHQKVCASQNFVLFSLRQIEIFLNDISPALTAIATAAIAGFTYTLYISTKESARITNDALKLARDEFIATHRPRIFVQTVFLADFGELGESLIDFWAVNAGETNAKIVSFFAFPYILDPGGEFIPNFDKPGPTTPKDALVLAPGEPVLIRAASASIVSEYMNHVVGESELFVVGQVEYMGDDKISRVTGFCREYMRGEGVYRTTGDQAHEYAY